MIKKNADRIKIRRLAVETSIGVPDEERANTQTLWVSISLQPVRNFDELRDDVALTIDYYEVSLRVVELAAEKPRHLIETLAKDITEFLIQNYPVNYVNVEIEKRILDNADYVAVQMERFRDSSAME